MKANPITWLRGCAMAGAIWMVSFSAAADGQLVKLPFSHVEAVNFTNMTFTVTLKETNLTVRITSQTRAYLYGRPTSSKNIEVADHVHGIVRKQADGEIEAVRIHLSKLAPK